MYVAHHSTHALLLCDYHVWHPMYTTSSYAHSSIASLQGSVKVLYAPTVEEIKLQLKMFAPTLVYLSAGYQQQQKLQQDKPPTLNSLILQNIGSTGGC